MFNSSSTLGSEKSTLLDASPVGTYKVKYVPENEWDFAVETDHEPVDLSLVLPHYRARIQPVDHRMNMFVGSNSGPIKVEVRRNISRSRFCLEIQAVESDVTVWLPSDFKGHIHHSGRASFSSGFINRIMHNAHLNEEIYDHWDGDDVVISTKGSISFRMWDVVSCSSENRRRETLKRLFRCTSKAPETPIDWDFLLDD